MLSFLISLLKKVSGKVWIGLLAGGLFVICLWFANWKADMVESEIAEANRKVEEANAKLVATGAIIQKMHDEHEAALESANAALRERIKIYETARERICEAEKRIGGHSDFCNQFVPDDITGLLYDENAAGVSKNHIRASE